jgi:hypothetical protein
MARYSGSGWHKQSVRHSNARKYGKAGGQYSWQRIAGGYEINDKTGKVRATSKYGTFGEIQQKAVAERGLKILKGIMSKEDIYGRNRRSSNGRSRKRTQKPFRRSKKIL